MIFVTVGTHEQPFNRLIERIDNLKADNVITEDVIIQTGYSTYEPRNCKWQKLFPYNEMERNVAEARIVITHGGPASFIMPLRMGKTPIVVPRMKEFNEHVNNHQVDFCNEVGARMKSIIVINDIGELEDTIENYDKIITSMNNNIENNNVRFCKEIGSIVDELMK